MKYVKFLGPLAIAAAALMAFAGSASAIVVTEAPNDPIDVGDTIEAASTHLQFTSSVPLTCTHSVMKGTVTQAGGKDVKGNTTSLKAAVSSITWGNNGVCNSGATLSTVKAGELELVYKGLDEGTLTWYGTEVTWLTHSVFLGTVHCILKTNSVAEGGTHIGTVKGKTLTISSAPIPEIATSSLCKEDVAWHGDYTFISPAGWDID